jgi:hypothetical protein
MTEATPPDGGETPPPSENNETPPPAVTAEDVARLQAALDKERDARKTYERQVKEFDSQRKASMTETERAIAEAEERGRIAVRSEYGQRLAQTEFRAAAAARDPEYDVAKALKYVNLAAFVGEDGEPDAKAIAAAVADLVPERNANPAPPSFDGGSRQPAAGGPSMTQLIRQAAGRA